MYEGERVRLRAFDNSDLMPCLRFRNDYAVMRTAQGGILYPATVDDVGSAMGENSSRASGAYQFAIETKEDRRFIGQCGFLSVNWKNRVGEAAILIGEEAYRGKGYGADAMKTLCRFAFEEMNLRKIKASVFDFNTPALRGYQKCGFQQEGLLRREIYREGAYHDVMLLCLFREGGEEH